MHHIQTKQSIRQEVKVKRLELSPERIDALSLQIAKSISALEVFKKASILFLYAAFPFEVQTKALHQLALKEGKKVAYPKVCSNTHEMNFYEVEEIKALVPTLCGNKIIDEPDPLLHKKMMPSPEDLLIVPGVAFDRQKNRLGYGGGFYDRYLNKHAIYTIGIGFEVQLIDKVPTDAWDEPLDCILTEEKTIF